MKCPACNTDADGVFCSNCGTRLAGRPACSRCGSELPDGARFCVQCGARASGTAALLRYAVPAALVALALLGGYWLGGRDGVDTSLSSTSPVVSPADRATPPPLTGSLRDQADRLFERIMQARARGDTAEASFFLPMALQAYQGAEPLDADGLFHLGLLQLENGRAADAVATAARIRETDASHLFGFALAGEAALASGDAASARAAYSGYLARFDAEVERDLREYEMHRPALDEYRARAVEVTR